MLGEWWIANPAIATDDFEPPPSAERVPGTLSEVAQGEFALETIGFVRVPSPGSENRLRRLFRRVGELLGYVRRRLASVEDPQPQVASSAGVHIWGSDRGGQCFSLLDCSRTSGTRRYPSIAGGHEDWAVHWIAKGNAWVTPDYEIQSAWLRTDDLRTWALFGRPETKIVDDTRTTAEVDLREETLGSEFIDELSISLVRFPSSSSRPPWDARAHWFSIDNKVSWKIEGSLTLQAIVEEWCSSLERFTRFMTMTPSVIDGIDCRLPDHDGQPVLVELTLPRLPRDLAADGRRRDAGSKPDEFLTTWQKLDSLGIDPMDVFASYLKEVAAGDAYTAMVLHLESQDRLLNRGADGALLNGIRSVESLYAARNPTVREDRVAVQTKIDSAVVGAGAVGKKIASSWPEISQAGKLRRQVAHGKSRPSADFGLRCLGGATSLQWLQRLHLLCTIGIDDANAQGIILDNPRFKREIGSLMKWNAEL